MDGREFGLLIVPHAIAGQSDGKHGCFFFNDFESDGLEGKENVVHRNCHCYCKKPKAPSGLLGVLVERWRCYLGCFFLNRHRLMLSGLVIFSHRLSSLGDFY